MGAIKFHELIYKVVIHKDADEETAQLILNWAKAAQPIVLQSNKSFQKGGDDGNV